MQNHSICLGVKLKCEQQISGVHIKIHHACSIHERKRERRWDRDGGIWTSSLTFSPLVLEISPLRASLTHISCLALLKCDANLNRFFFLFTVDWSCALCCLLLFISLSYISLVLPHSCKTHVSIPNKRSTSKSLSSSVFLSCQ